MHTAGSRHGAKVGVLAQGHRQGHRQGEGPGAGVVLSCRCTPASNA
jgi:hypothetical protein